MSDLKKSSRTKTSYMMITSPNRLRNETRKLSKSLPIFNRLSTALSLDKTGVGKTAVTKYLLQHLEQDASQYDDLQVQSVYLNCEDLTSSYRVAVALVNNPRASDNQISRTGYPLNAVYDMLWEKLDEVDSDLL